MLSTMVAVSPTTMVCRGCWCCHSCCWWHCHHQQWWECSCCHWSCHGGADAVIVVCCCRGHLRLLLPWPSSVTAMVIGWLLWLFLRLWSRHCWLSWLFVLPQCWLLLPWSWVMGCCCYCQCLLLLWPSFVAALVVICWCCGHCCSCCPGYCHIIAGSYDCYSCRSHLLLLQAVLDCWCCGHQFVCCCRGHCLMQPQW